MHYCDWMLSCIADWPLHTVLGHQSYQWTSVEDAICQTLWCSKWPPFRGHSLLQSQRRCFGLQIVSTCTICFGIWIPELSIILFPVFSKQPRGLVENIWVVQIQVELTWSIRRNRSHVYICSLFMLWRGICHKACQKSTSSTVAWLD